MKNTLKTVIVATLVVVVLSPLRARAAATVYAEEIASDSVVAASEPVSETNATVTRAHETNIALSEKANVRIDKTGIHIGGPHPVDINVPALAHHREDKGLDVVGIVGVVFGCSIPIAIVCIIFYFRHCRLKMHHETIRAMVEKGVPIPPEMAAGTRSDLLLGNTDVRAGRGDFRGGLILVAVGAALLMIVGKVGWILVFIGAARLIFWLVEERNPKV